MMTPACGMKCNTGIGSRLGHVQLRGFFRIQCWVDTGENRPVTEKETDTEIMMWLPEQF